MSSDIYIDDLINPVFSDMQKAALEFGEGLSVNLSCHSIMKEAEQKTGCSDWGENDFIERLTLLCDEWNADDGLTGVGRFSLRNKLVQHATSRLLIQDQFNRHPEIHDIQIEKPIIVAGLPRSGTTHLLNLMASDSRLRALPLWESYEPVPMPGESLRKDGADPRYKRCADAWAMMQQVSPYLAAMHPMNPDHIHEELELMGPNFGSYNYEWLNYSPRWRDNYYAEDQAYQYEYMRDVLKLLLWQQRDTDRPTRWVLKCPQHLEQLPVLHKVFPDATVAITHRDPVSVIQSAITMLAYGQRMTRRKIMAEELLEYWTDRVEHLLDACARDRGVLPEAQSIDVPFHELIRDDLGWVEKIYSKAGLEMTEQSRSELSQFVEGHRDDYGRVIYDLKGQFGVDPDDLRERFHFYYKAFPVKRARG
ncbi:MAG: sulfotransferase family protein [Endozoicomonas sp.]